MQSRHVTATRNKESILATNAVLRNTYLLLSLTLLFSAGVAAFAMSINAPYPGIIVFLIGMFGLSMLTNRLRNSPWGLVSIFAFTGFLGYMLGPILNMYLHTYVNGGQLIMTALGSTGVIFLALSAYALTTRKDFSYLGGFLFAGIMIAFILGIGATVFNMPMLSLGVSGAFALLSSGLILYQTSQIINGGERNYIMATITLFMALFNLFISLLNILGAFAGQRS